MSITLRSESVAESGCWLNYSSSEAVVCAWTTALILVESVLSDPGGAVTSRSFLRYNAERVGTWSSFAISGGTSVESLEEAVDASAPGGGVGAPQAVVAPPPPQAPPVPFAPVAATAAPAAAAVAAVPAVDEDDYDA